MVQNAKVLVTGASGLVGTSLALELAKHNEVYGLARFSDAAKRERLVAAGVKLLVKDALTDDVADVPDDFDYVFHEMLTGGDWPTAYRGNVFFLGRLMEHLAHARGFVLGATGGFYAAAAEPQTEDAPPGPVGNYLLGKFAMEVLAQYVCETRQRPTVILRYYWPYGADRGLVVNMAQQVRDGVPLDAARMAHRYQPLYTGDCAVLTIKAAALCSVPATVVNVGGSETVTGRQIAQTIGAVLGIEPTFTGEPPAEAPTSHLGDFTRMRERLGRPKTSLQEGIRLSLT